MKVRVNSITGKNFRRNGITFTGTPQEIDSEHPPNGAAPWTAAEIENLRAAGAAGGNVAKGDALSVVEIDDNGKPVKASPGTPAEAVAAASVAGESLPGHPTQAEADAATKGRRGR